MVLKNLLRKNPLGLLSICVLLAYVAIAVLAPYLARPQPGLSPYEIPRDGFYMAPRPPSENHPFGTTEGQLDIYYGMIWGTRTAFRLAVIVVTCAFGFGALVGSVSGYVGGAIDELVMRITDVFLAFPFLLAAMVLATILGQGLDSMIIALTAFGWMPYARLVRSEVLRLKEIAFVESARAIGVPNWRIIRVYILPNCIYPALIQASMDVGSVVMTASALSFLGLGVQAGYADWGELISLSRNWILGGAQGAFQYWYTLVFPGGGLFIFVLAWNVLGDTLRDVFDPRMKRV